MCGIAGLFWREARPQPPARERLLAMASALPHRGPDEVGIYRHARAGLAHTRLSIIDLRTGQQPMANEDETLWLVYNGEIYNYIELRAELRELGHTFRTQSDTEVVLHAFEAWGEDAFARFNGQFAAAIWNETSEELVLARDRFGICPLYYAEQVGRVSFASEVKALFAGEPELSRALDPVGLAQTFTFWSVVPPQSVFRGVSELPPASVRRYASGREPVERRYWTLPFPEHRSDMFSGSVEEAAEAVLEKLERATALRMLRADVPVGSYLSGGLDSSFVAALARRAQSEQFRTFSIRFADAEHDETRFQRTMAKRLGTEHHEVMVTEEDIANAMPEVVHAAERPIVRTGPAPLYMLSKLVRESGIKVVLTGEGADEMFGGYDLFREGKIRRFWGRQPGSTCRPRLLERLYPYLTRSASAQQELARAFYGRGIDGGKNPGFSHRTRWQTSAGLLRLLGRDLRAELGARDVSAELLSDLPPPLSNWEPLSQDQYLECRTLLAGYLLSSQGDRMLMVHSVEGRFPFLDSELVDMAATLPASFKLRALDEKHVLKRAAERFVPEEILERQKQPYRAPDGVCFVRKNAPSWVLETTDERRIAAAGVFEPGAVRALFEKCRNNPHPERLSNADNMAVVGVLSTQLLFDRFIDEPPTGGTIPSPRTEIER